MAVRFILRDDRLRYKYRVFADFKDFGQLSLQITQVTPVVAYDRYAGNGEWYPVMGHDRFRESRKYTFDHGAVISCSLQELALGLVFEAWEPPVASPKMGETV